jgi:hypothetical protein
MIDLRQFTEERPLSLPDAASYIGKLTGVAKPNVSTLWRWCLKGCKGVKLDSICIGGKRFVTAAAIERFIEALTAARQGQTGEVTSSPPPPSPARPLLAHVMRHNDRRRDEIDSARRRLDEITGVAKPSSLPSQSA